MLKKLLLLIIAIVVITFCIVTSLFLFDLIKTRFGSSYNSCLNILSKDIFALYKKVSGQEDCTDELKKEIDKMASYQADVDNWLYSEYSSKNHDFTNPLIVVNPYGTSPESAAMMFHTGKPVKVSVVIKGDSALTNISKDFLEYKIDHFIPIFGLYFGRENTVELSLTDIEGNIETRCFVIQTDSPPEKLSLYNIRAYSYDKCRYQYGLNFTYTLGSTKTKCALDANGACRWYLDLSKYSTIERNLTQATEYYDGNRIFVCTGKADNGSIYILEFNALGKLKASYYSRYGAHHDVELLSDNTLMATGGTQNDIESLVYSMSMETGEVNKCVDLTDVFQNFRNQLGNNYNDFYSDSDNFHLNNIDEMSGDSLLLSIRNQSTIACTDRNMKIKWMLCDPKGYYNYFKQFILQPKGDNFFYPCVQHHANELPDQDGNPDTVDILVFDNGSLRNEKISRLVQYRINTKDKTAEVVWNYGDNRPEIFSNYCGSAFLLENGNYLGCFIVNSDNGSVPHTYVVEVDCNKNIVWECWITCKDRKNGCNSYRVERADIYLNVEDSFLYEKAKIFN